MQITLSRLFTKYAPLLICIAIVTLPACAPTNFQYLTDTQTFPQFYKNHEDHTLTVDLLNGEQIESRRHEFVGEDSLRLKESTYALTEIHKITAERQTIWPILIAGAGISAALLTNIPKPGCSTSNCVPVEVLHVWTNVVYKALVASAGLFGSFAMTASTPKKVYILNPK